MKIHIPEFALLFLVGAAASGKSTFARKHFRATEILSSDHCRAMVCDDENDQAATRDAFEILHLLAEKRLRRGRLTVIDATNVQAGARSPLLSLARRYHCPASAIVFRLPEKVCLEQNRKRDRVVIEEVLLRQSRDLEKSLSGLKREGFQRVFVLESPEEIRGSLIRRTSMPSNRKKERGPFDIIAGIRGCGDELLCLMETLGYEIGKSEESERAIRHPKGRKAVFLGNIIGAGPKNISVLRMVMGMVEKRNAFCVLGEQEYKFRGKLMGKDVGSDEAMERLSEELKEESPEFQEKASRFIRNLYHHYVFDQGKLVVAHAGMMADMQGRASPSVRKFALYGDEGWVEGYRGEATVVYGHRPVSEPRWSGRTLNIDTGCVSGGKLTALRYPEKELVSVAAKQCYEK